MRGHVEKVSEKGCNKLEHQCEVLGHTFRLCSQTGKEQVTSEVCLSWLHILWYFVCLFFFPWGLLHDLFSNHGETDWKSPAGNQPRAGGKCYTLMSHTCSFFPNYTASTALRAETTWVWPRLKMNCHPRSYLHPLDHIWYCTLGLGLLIDLGRVQFSQPVRNKLENIKSSFGLF